MFLTLVFFCTQCWSLEDYLSSINYYHDIDFPKSTYGMLCTEATQLGTLWCFGGQTGNTDVISFNGSSESFTTHTDLSGATFDLTNVGAVQILDTIAYFVADAGDYIITYDLITQTTDTTFAGFPENMNHARIATNNIDMLYFGASSVTQTIRSYNITSNTWYTFNNQAQSSHSYGGLAYWDYKLYLFGSTADIDNKLEYVSVYDDSGFVDSKDKDLVPYDYDHFSLVIIPSGLMYLLQPGSSTQYGDKFGAVHIYDPEEDTFLLSSAYILYLSTSSIDYEIIGSSCTFYSSDFRMWCFGGRTYLRYHSSTTGFTFSSTNYVWKSNKLYFTMDPTLSPTEVPSTQPTLIPSNNPTMSSNEPTIATNSPTFLPTNDPSLNPSQQPTNQPSLNPSEHPTNQPSSNPSENPTKNPTTENDNDANSNNSSSNNNNNGWIIGLLIAVIVLGLCFCIAIIFIFWILKEQNKQQNTTKENLINKQITNNSTNDAQLRSTKTPPRGLSTLNVNLEEDNEIELEENNSVFIELPKQPGNNIHETEGQNNNDIEISEHEELYGNHKRKQTGGNGELN